MTKRKRGELGQEKLDVPYATLKKIIDRPITIFLSSNLDKIFHRYR